MRSSLVSAPWARVLLAVLVVLDFVGCLVHAAMMEDNSDYQSCISNPSGCTRLCAARLPPSLSLGRNQTQECGDVRRGWDGLYTCRYIDGRGLTGTIPTEIGRLTALTDL